MRPICFDIAWPIPASTVSPMTVPRRAKFKKKRRDSSRPGACVCVCVCLRFFGQARLACNRGVLSIPCEEAARIAEAFLGFSW